MQRRHQLLDYLRSQHVMTIATMGTDGPWAAAVFYASEQLKFYFLSAPGTRHCRDFAIDARVAATIAGDCADWRDIKGVQIAASVRQLFGEECEAAKRIYAAKFPGAIDARGLPRKIADALQAVRWYELNASRIRFIDNSLGFGHRDEWSAAEFPQ